MAADTARVLESYVALMSGGWPTVDPCVAAIGPEPTPQQLRNAIEAATTPLGVRVFWKFGEDLLFGGCNLACARDGGLTSPEGLVGRSDYDMPWRLQASAYRMDDLAVMHSGKPKLGILERQRNTGGFLYLYTSKVPIRGATRCVGIFGGYELLEKPEFDRRLSERAQMV